MALVRLRSALQPAEIGELSETIELLSQQPPAQPLVSLAQSLGLATAITAAPHGFQPGDYVRIAGANEAGYLGEVAIVVVDAVTFAYPVDPATPSPASGTITATFVQDAHGGGSSGWHVVETVRASVRPQRGDEVLQAEAIQSIVRYLIEIRYRVDLSPRFRVRWRPYRHPAPGRLLEIHTVREHPDSRRRRLVLDCSEVAS